MTTDALTDEPVPDSTRSGRRRRIALEVLALVALVGLSHFTRLGDLPLLGEEGRRGRSAINMIETGDWIVVRNQDVVFPDRPPMTNWLIAGAGLARGAVDLVAIRLPSSLAVLLTALLLYGYCRRLGSSFEALAAAAVYVTCGQVLQLGRLGESEAVFVLFVAAALLLWHLGFALGWPPTLAWSLGYALTALAALTKGLQAPVYFVGATAAFLLWNRRWRWLFGWGQWIGAGVFLAIVLAWQIPYYLATDWPSVVGTWFAVVGPRLAPSNLLAHLATFPLEILASLLPWSPVLLLAASPAVRAGLRASDLPERGSRVTFLVAAIAVTFPTVWLSAGAKPRYYMPLYPLIAISIAMILVCCVAGHGRTDLERTPPAARLWRRWLTAADLVVFLLLALVALAHVLPETSLGDLRPSGGWLVAILLAGVAAIGATRFARSRPGSRSAAAAVLLVAAFVAMFHGGSVVTQLVARRQDPGPAVASLRARLPGTPELVSFGPIHTKFLYYWGDLVPETPWPRTLADLPPDVEYFSFDRRPWHTEESRLVTRGMEEWTTPGALPFVWEELGVVDCGRKPMDPPDAEVVVGRVVRDAEGRPVPASP